MASRIGKGSGPFTVFAPTNDAFAMLPTATVDSGQHIDAKMVSPRHARAMGAPDTIKAAHDFNKNDG